MNLADAFLPGRRSDPDSFLIALGLVALIDGLRLSLLEAGGWPLAFAPILLLCAAAFINRLRAAGRQGPLVILPLGAALSAKALVGLIGMLTAITPMTFDYMRERGLDPSDPEDMQAAAADPEFQAGFQRYVLDNQERAAEAISAGDWPSTLAWWAVIIGFGFWAARLRVLR
jgi:hypothetical protein